MNIVIGLRDNKPSEQKGLKKKHIEKHENRKYPEKITI